MESLFPYNILSVEARIVARLAELESEVARANENTNERVKNNLLTPLLSERGSLQNDLEDLRSHWSYSQALQGQKDAQERASQRSLMERRQARFDRASEERAAYDRRVTSEINWGLTPALDMSEKRVIARTHLEALSKQAEMKALLADPAAQEIIRRTAVEQGLTLEALVAMMSPKPFETRIVLDDGRVFLITADERGSFCEQDAKSARFNFED